MDFHSVRVQCDTCCFVIKLYTKNDNIFWNGLCFYIFCIRKENTRNENVFLSSDFLLYLYGQGSERRENCFRESLGSATKTRIFRLILWMIVKMIIFVINWYFALNFLSSSIFAVSKWILKMLCFSFLLLKV